VVLSLIPDQYLWFGAIKGVGEGKAVESIVDAHAAAKVRLKIYMTFFAAASTSKYNKRTLRLINGCLMTLRHLAT
jgi:hypothetical protein